MKMSLKIAVAAFCCLLLQFGTGANAQNPEWSAATGWDDLMQELGSNAPSGSGVTVSQVEAPTGNEGYQPDSTSNEYLNPDKTFTDLSGLNNLVSVHANGVGSVIYGNNSSIAPGVVDVYLYEANDWLNNGLGFAGNGNPAPHPYSVQNHSWIANGQPVGIVTSLLGRADFLANQYNLNIVVGVGNTAGANTPQLLAHGFNSISVGVTSGDHSFQPTTLLGAGRRKPELVAIAGSTSFATARISALASLMREATAGTNAENNEVVKAILLAGATKTEFADWDQTQERPLDDVFGVGEANIYNSYKIFEAGEVDGAAAPTEFGGSEGWDFESIEAGGTRSYIIEITEPAAHMSVVLTWNRQINDGAANPDLFSPQAVMPDLDLLISSDGAAQFSTSTVDNIEHIYLTDIQPGQYFVIVSSNRDADYSLAWRTAERTDSLLSDVQVQTGSDNGGSPSDLEFDDSNFYIARPGLKTGTGFLTTVEFESTTSISMPNDIKLSIDGFANTPNLDVEFSFFNFTTQEFVAMQSMPMPTSESNVAGQVIGELNDFVEPGTGVVRARATWAPVGPVLMYPWSIVMDRAVFEISQ